MSAPRLSLTMIVKNEEKHIRRVLSTAPLYADEIVIVDTGSTDRTKEIAREFTDKVYDFAWIDDFSAARNFGIARCTGDFVMWLDADDVISEKTAARIREMIRSNPSWDLLYMPYNYSRNARGETTIMVMRERIFRNGVGAEFHFPIHECLRIPPQAKRFTVEDIEVFHDPLGKGEGSEQSNPRNLRMLKAAVQREEYKNDFRMWQHLAKMLPPEEAISHFQKIVDDCFQGLGPATRSRTLIDYGNAYMQLSRFEDALNVFGRALVTYPLWREPYFYSAIAMAKLKRFDCALQMLRTAERLEKPGKDALMYDPALHGGEYFYDWLYFVQFHAGAKDELEETVYKALRANPRSELFRKRQQEHLEQRAAQLAKAS